MRPSMSSQLIVWAFVRISVHKIHRIECWRLFSHGIFFRLFPLLRGSLIPNSTLWLKFFAQKCPIINIVQTFSQSILSGTWWSVESKAESMNECRSNDSIVYWLNFQLEFANWKPIWLRQSDEIISNCATACCASTYDCVELKEGLSPGIGRWHGFFCDSWEHLLHLFFTDIFTHRPHVTQCNYHFFLRRFHVSRGIVRCRSM